MLGIIKFTNGLLLKDGQLVPGELLTSSQTGRIIASQPACLSVVHPPDRVVDLKGKIISPGFIDVQLNGGYDFDFSVPSPGYRERFRSTCQQLIKTGVTSFTPSVTSQLPEIYHAVLPHLGPSLTRLADDGTESLGAHVEGPFLNPTKNGIHTASVLRTAQTWADVESCYGSENLGSIRYMTAAPEQGEMNSLIPDIISHEILFSIGHSEATFEQAQAALNAGATMVTHMFNAMRPFGHRDPGVFGLLGQNHVRPTKSDPSPKSGIVRSSTRSSASPSPTSTNHSRLSFGSEGSDNDEPPEQTLSLQPPFFGLIADGVHLSGPAVKIAYAAYPAGAVLVTDAMRLSGCPDGIYDWTNGERIVKKGNLLTLEKNGRIAGSAITLIECINNFLEFTGADVASALTCVTETPARMLSKDVASRKGKLDVGMDADLVILDHEDGYETCTGTKTIRVNQVWKFGQLVSF